MLSDVKGWCGKMRTAREVGLVLAEKLELGRACCAPEPAGARSFGVPLFRLAASWRVCGGRTACAVVARMVYGSLGCAQAGCSGRVGQKGVLGGNIV